MKVENMKWADMEGLITRRLNTLAMCKRGAVETDINQMTEKLGEYPIYTKAELKEQGAKLAKEKQIACKVTIQQCKDMSGSELNNMTYNRLLKIDKKAGVHPGAKIWTDKSKAIKEQRVARLAALDGDFMDVTDTFRLGIKDISEFPAESERLEAMAW